MEFEIHPIQSDILLVLLFKPEARFTELNTTKISNDHLTFHVKKLVEHGLIEKTKKGTYRLTTKGKEFANRYDTESVVLERQAKVAVLVICIKGNEYLVQQRLKQPYYGFWGFVTGKIRWGEMGEEAAKRELKEETGLEGNLVLRGVKHKIDYSQEGSLLEDKYFFVFRATELKGSLLKKFSGGKNKWMTKNKIYKLNDLFDGVKESLEIAQSSKLIFMETEYKVARGY